MKNKAFTLAEVLITLSIIGVVAALTIPSLVVKNQEKQTVVQLKKAYNVFSNAFSLAVVEYGDPSGWGWGADGNPQGAINGADKLAANLNLIKYCRTDKGCYPSNVTYKTFDNGSFNVLNDTTDRSKGLLADGMSFFVYSYDPNCTSVRGVSEDLKNTCGSLNIDVNGFKGPNRVGIDTFEFFITKSGIIPRGTKDGTDVKRCRNEGVDCTAWVLLKENMDYPPAGTGWDGKVVTP